MYLVYLVQYYIYVWTCGLVYIQNKGCDVCAACHSYTFKTWDAMCVPHATKVLFSTKTRRNDVNQRHHLHKKIDQKQTTATEEDDKHGNLVHVWYVYYKYLRSTSYVRTTLSA